MTEVKWTYGRTGADGYYTIKGTCQICGKEIAKARVGNGPGARWAKEMIIYPKVRAHFREHEKNSLDTKKTLDIGA